MRNFKAFAYLMLLTLVCSISFAFLTSYGDVKANTQEERVEASIANDQHQSELEAVINRNNGCIQSINDENPIVGTIEISKKTYDVREGPRGGLYIWRVRMRDTSAGTKGSCYKASLTQEQRSLVIKH